MAQGGHGGDHYSGGFYGGDNAGGHFGHGHGLHTQANDRNYHGIIHSLHPPHGNLAGDLLGSAAYISAGFVGAHDVAHYSHINTADALTIAMILSAAESFGGAHGHSDAIHGYTEITLAQMPGFGGYGDASNSDPGKPAKLRHINKPGVARSKQGIEMTWYFHGQCDPFAEINRLALKFGAKRIKPNAWDASCTERDDTVEWITSNVPFTDPKNKFNKPNGWFKNVRGKTRLWRRFYQLRPSMNPIWGQPKFDIKRTFLVVAGAQWYYETTGDYETRITFMVYSKDRVNRNGVDTFDWLWIDKHMGLAEKLMQGGLTYIRQDKFKAPESAVQARMKIAPEDYEPEVPPKLPAPHAVSGGPMSTPPSAMGIDEDDPRLREEVSAAVQRRLGDSDSSSGS